MRRDRSLIPLSHQHQHGLALCVDIERGLAAGAPPESFAERVIQHYESELTPHFQVEERVLFPAIPGQMVDALTAEHREIERLAAAIRSDPRAGALRAFAALLRTHIRKEENELFEEIQRRLPRAELDALGAAITARIHI